jgi:hypothetical protein
MFTAAYPYARLSLIAHGDSLEHWYAVPLMQPEEAFESRIGWLLISHICTGLNPGARLNFPGQAQDGLQQSQYLVVVPEPEAPAFAWRMYRRRTRSVLVAGCMLRQSESKSKNAELGMD